VDDRHHPSLGFSAQILQGYRFSRFAAKKRHVPVWHSGRPCSIVFVEIEGGFWTSFSPRYRFGLALRTPWRTATDSSANMRRRLDRPDAACSPLGKATSTLVE